MVKTCRGRPQVCFSPGRGEGEGRLGVGEDKKMRMKWDDDDKERWHVLEKNLLEFTVKEKWKYKIKKETKRKRKHWKEIDSVGGDNDDIW